MALLIGLVAAAAWAPQAAWAAPANCAGTVRGIQDQLAAITAPVRANPRLAQGQGRADLQTKVAGVFAAARRDNPECKAEIDQVAKALRSQAGERATGAHAKGFLGPVGWTWNQIYYRVFQGNNVMMAIFGWELFLAPIILVLAASAVLRGVRGALHRPVVPDYIRSS